MVPRSYLNALAFVLATFLVTVSQAQQPMARLSKNKTGIEAPGGLSEAVKYLPKILDNKNIDFKKNNYTPPKRFDVTKTDGPGSGGGGNACAMGIVKLTKEILGQGFWQANLGQDQEQALKNAIQNAIFVQGDNLPAVRGEKKNAINFPDRKLIVVDSKACDVITAGGTPGYSLLIHEYMGLAGIDDRDYSASLSFIESLYREAPARDGDKPIFDRVIREVNICAASCQSEILGHEGHDRAEVGIIYYIPAKDSTRRMNTAECIEKAKEVIVISNSKDDAVDFCAAAMTGKYWGKDVDIYTSAPETGFLIQPSYKRKK